MASDSTPSMGSNSVWRCAKNTELSPRDRKRRYARSLRQSAASPGLSSRRGPRKMLSKSEIQAELCTALEELFDLPPKKIPPGARLVEDLDLDSIDAVDLMARLQQFTGKRIASAEFK